MSELSLRWLGLGLDASLKALLLAAVAAAVLRILRVRDSNVRHRVWFGVLAGMLLMPLLAQVVPALGLPLAFPTEWLSAMAASEAESAPATVEAPELGNVVAETAPHVQESTAGGAGAVDSTRAPWDQRPPGWDVSRHGAADQTRFSPTDAPDSATPPDSAEISASPPAESAPLAKPAATESPYRRWLAYAPPVLTGVWLTGAALLGLRLALGMWLAFRLRRDSTPIDADVLAEFMGQPSPPLVRGGDACGFAAPVSPRRLRAEPPFPVFECPLVRVPLTLGSLRPQILLPPDWIDWPAEKLHAVLTHEQTHVARADCAVALLSEINRCVYWFHPLAWWLRGHLAGLAEAACDDAAIDSTGDRACYARHLLEVAAAVSPQSGRVLPVGVSMARKPHVETRINAILDLTRPLSRRLTWGATLVILGLVVPLIAIAAALRPGEAQVEDAVVEAAAANDVDLSDATVSRPLESGRGTANGVSETRDATPPSPPLQRGGEARAGDDVTFQFAGTVVDLEGKPVAGAAVRLSYWRKEPPPDDAPPDAISDAQGKFEFTCKQSSLSDGGKSRDYLYAGVIATKDTYGFAYGPAFYFETTGKLEAELPDVQRRWISSDWGQKTHTLTLVPDDVPVRGRILDIQGRPVAGAKIEAVSVWEGQQQSLAAWEKAAKEPSANYFSARAATRPLVNGNFLSGPRATAVPVVHTAADGWFTLKGLGRERIAEVFVSGPAIETHYLHVRSRQGDVIRLSRSDRGDSSLGEYAFYPNEFTLVVGPSVPVEGRVTEIKTGAALADVLIKCNRMPTNSSIGPPEAGYIRTTTRADGRYRLEGLPLGTSGLIVLPPIGSAQLPGTFDVSLTTGEKPHVQDVVLGTGVLVRGRVKDSRTGKPLAGNLDYFAFLTNPHLEDAGSFRRAFPRYEYRSDDQGEFQIPVLPGKGILAFTAHDHENYPRGAGVERIEGPNVVMDGQLLSFSTAPTSCNSFNHHLLTPLDPSPDDRELTLDLSLGSGVSFTGRVLSPEGTPLSDFYVRGYESFPAWRKFKGPPFEVTAYFPKEGRRLMFYQPERDLVGTHEVAGDPPRDLTVTLRRGATIVGRLVDSEGLPIENAQIHNASRQMESSAAADRSALDRGILLQDLDGRPFLTDSNGRFELKGIIPGLKYTAGASGPGMFEGQMQMRFLGTLFTDVTAEPGETKDVGDLRPQPQKPEAVEKPNKGTADKPSKDGAGNKPAAQANPAVPAPAAQRAPSEAAAKGQQAQGEKDSAVTIRGRVLKPDSSPAAGATVYALRFSDFEIVGSASTVVLAQGRTTEVGAFVLKIPNEPQRVLGESGAFSHAYAIVALAQGFGPDWEGIKLSAESLELTLRLVEDSRPIEGRVLNLEGRPIAGVRIRVRSIAAADSDIDKWIAGARSNPPPGEPTLQKTAGVMGFGPSSRSTPFPNGKRLAVASLPGFTETLTGADGRFRIAGIGSDRLASLVLEGESIAKTWLDCVTHVTPPLHMAFQDPRYRSAQTYGATFDYVAEPTQVVTGRVHDIESGKPIPDVTIGVLQLGDSLLAISGFLSATTDSDGRYRLVGLPKTRGRSRPHRIQILPGRSQPYFRIDLPLPNEPEPASLSYDVGLRRGTWITGRVTEKTTGRPVPALISYYPFLDNPHAPKFTNFSPGTQSIRHDSYPTAGDGTFRVPAIPGRGVVMAVALDDQAYQIAVGADEIGLKSRENTEQPRLVYHIFGPDLANSVRAVEVDEQNANAVCDLDLVPHEHQSIEVRDAAGASVAGVIVGGSLARPPLFRGYSSSLRDQPKFNGTAELTGLEVDRRRLVLFLQMERRLGRAAIVEHATTEEVRLQPCATIVGRLVDRAGKPVANKSVSATIPETEFAVSKASRSWWFTVQYVTTDSEGRFKFDAIPPGVRYQVYYDSNASADVPVIRAGQSVDLGSLTVKPSDDDPDTDPTKGDAPAAAASVSKSANEPASVPATRQVTQTERPAARGETLTPALTQGENESVVTIRGRVLDPEGKPFVGATVYALGWYWSPEVEKRPLAESRSGADGRFEISYPNPKYLEDTQYGRMSGEELTIAAVAKGFGPGFVQASAIRQATGSGPVAEGDRELTLQLARDDVPISGRVVDLEGRPIAGVRVSVLEIQSAKTDLSPWLDAISRGNVNSAASEHLQANLPEYHVSGAGVVTDAAGRYRITGIGRERKARLLFEGPTIAYSQVDVVTRKIAPMQMVTRVFDKQTRPLYGADLEFTASPTQPILGTIRDAETGKPLAGVTVANSSWAPGIVGQRVVRAVTDGSGRYRLAGLPKAKGIEIMAIPNDHQPFFPQEAGVPETAGLEPITVDFQLNRGMWITGKVTDASTEGPVAGANVMYFPFITNDYAQKRTPEFGPFTGHQVGYQDRYQTRRDGTYRLVGLPGRAIVGVMSNYRSYRAGVGSEAIAGLGKNGIFPTYGFGAGPKWPNSMKEIDPPVGLELATCDLQLDPGEAIRVTVVGPDEKPVVGYMVEGSAPHYWTNAPRQHESFDAVNLGPDETRTILIRDEARGLGKAVHVRLDEHPTRAMTVKLEQFATVTGRLLDADANPLVGSSVRFTVLPAGNFGRYLPDVGTDKDGRFRHRGVLPGCEYVVFVEGKQMVETLAEKLSVNPGETIDLGTLRFDKNGRLVTEKLDGEMSKPEMKKTGVR
ncbi:MAG: M56 family metallopeptidase [Planctomycetaceae bacterium]